MQENLAMLARVNLQDIFKIMQESGHILCLHKISMYFLQDYMFFTLKMPCIILHGLKRNFCMGTHTKLTKQ